jgi:hypothetical protein
MEHWQVLGQTLIQSGTNFQWQDVNCPGRKHLLSIGNLSSAIASQPDRRSRESSETRDQLLVYLVRSSNARIRSSGIVGYQTTGTFLPFFAFKIIQYHT